MSNESKPSRDWIATGSKLAKGVGKVWEPTGAGGGSSRSIANDLTPSAKEWSPNSPPQQTTKPKVVKEFVPGVGLQHSGGNMHEMAAERYTDLASNAYAPNEVVEDPRYQQQHVEGQKYMDQVGAQAHHHLEAEPMAPNAAMGHQFMSAAEAEAYAQHGGMNSIGSIVDTPKLVSKGCQPIPPRRTLESMMLPENLRSYFFKQARLRMECSPPNDARLKEVPRRFHSILPLDDPAVPRGTAGSSGYPSSMYKVVNARDGFLYVLRRVDNVRVSHDTCASVVERWCGIRHANILPLREAFVQQRALYLVHDYLPGAESLAHYVAQQQGRILPERTIWSVCTQILAAIRAVHDANECCRGITPQRILLSGQHKVKLSSVGLMHLLESRTSKSLAELQHEDLLGLVRAILCLACMNVQALTDTQGSFEFIQNTYSPELCKLVSQPFRGACNVYDLLALASQGLLTEIDTLYSHSDALEEHLAMQYDNDRITRLMMKLGVITERPEAHGKNPADSWSETGDRYIIKLFRDYVFHQTTDTGQPWLDMGHIISCLNKLDLGSQEQLLLTARGGRSFLVVTYRDVRQCVEEAFQELMGSSSGRQHMGHM